MTEPPAIPDTPHTHTHSMPSLNLTKKIGPAPVWVWALLIAGTIGAVYWFRTRNTSGTSSPIDASGSGTVSGTGLDTSNTPGETLTDTSNTGNGVQGNGQWGIQAVQALIASGANPLTSSTAIANYLNGAKNSSAGDALVAKAISIIGPPPNGVLPSVSTAPSVNNPGNPPKGYTLTEDLSTGFIYENWPDGTKHHIDRATLAGLHNPPPIVKYGHPPANQAPKPSPPGKPPGTHPVAHPSSYTVKPGDTLGSIAKALYGSSAAWTKLRNANASKLPGNVGAGTNLRNGLVLTVPS